MSSSAYVQDGVDIEAGDDFSAFAGKICRSTWGFSQFVKVHDFGGHFRGPRGYSFQNLPEGFFEMGAPDGVGTKVAFTAAGKTHLHSARDLVAMGAADITRWGGMPLVFFNVLDVSTLWEKGTPQRALFEDLMTGLHNVATEQKMVLLGGETAELGPYVGSENAQSLTKYNWAGFTIGINHPDKIITGKRIQPGDVVVALREYGFRSNGLSAVRKAFTQHFGNNWWYSPQAKSAIKEAAAPSSLYDYFLSVCNGWYAEDFKPLFDIHGLIHISGGGIPGKFAEDILFPLGLSATLDDLWDPPEIMQSCAEWRGSELSGNECYEIWNGGQGMLAVLPQSEADQFIALAESSIEFNLRAKICGYIHRKTVPQLQIQSKFLDKGKKELRWISSNL